MSILTKIFKKNTDEEIGKVGGMEDFMTLIRVYYQAVMASKLGITNISMLPDLRVFKQTLKVPTINNKLGLGEKNKCKKMLTELYGISEDFFKEIDNSIKKNCHNPNDIRNYLFMFQGFSQNLLMLISNTQQWKLRIPRIFKKTLRSVTDEGINDILTKENWKDMAIRKGCYEIRSLQKKLDYSEEWMKEYVFHIVYLAKKEKRPKDTEIDKK